MDDTYKDNNTPLVLAFKHYVHFQEIIETSTHRTNYMNIT